MLGVGHKFPQFNLNSCVGTEEESCFKEISNETYKDQWLVVFSYPMDFTFVCPTEIVGFNAKVPELKTKNAQLLGMSVDSQYSHLAWRNQNPDLKNLEFPLMSDIKRELSMALGILDHNTGVANRATFIVDPQGYIRYSEIVDMNVGRNPHETMRILDALQNGALCPCNWKKGEDTL